MSRAAKLTQFATAYDTGGISQFKNRIINGDMRIDQRNAGASVTAGYSVDRFSSLERSGYTTLTVTAQQTSDAAPNFTKSVKVTVGTGQAVQGTGGYMLGADHRIEGHNFADFGFGTASAQPFTLSFWVKSSIAGTYPVSFFNAAVNRAYLATYTINATNTWEYKTLTISGDPSGAWNTTNGIGLGIQFAIAAGSGSNGTPGAWSSSYKSSVAGMPDIGATSGATWQITGVQLEKGSTATSFDYRPYGTELALCQRYYQVYPSASSYSLAPLIRFQFSINAYQGTLAFQVPMRATPTGTLVGVTQVHKPGIIYDTITSASATSQSSIQALMSVVPTTNSTDCVALWLSNGAMTFASEL